MGFAEDIASDYQIIDGGETVTVTQKRASVTTTATVHNATNAPLSRRQLQALGGVALGGNEKSWSLNATEVGAPGSAIGDTIADANSAVWRVLSVEELTLGTRWKAVTRKQQ